MTWHFLICILQDATASIDFILLISVYDGGVRDYVVPELGHSAGDSLWACPKRRINSMP